MMTEALAAQPSMAAPMGVPPQGVSAPGGQDGGPTTVPLQGNNQPTMGATPALFETPRETKPL